MNTDEIKARLAAATPGPWVHEITQYMDDYGAADGPPVARVVVPVDTAYDGPSCLVPLASVANAVLIAHAPADIAALLAEVERLGAAHADASLAFDQASALTVDLQAALEKAEAERDEWRRVAEEQTRRAFLAAEERDEAVIFASTRGPMCQCSDDESCRMMREMHLARRERDDLRADRDHWREVAESRPAVTGEDAFTWIGCHGGPTEKKVHKELKRHGLAWAAAERAHASGGGS
jgi:ElaB/YqjD/DUF883 family membrane-anchored ribosome-binding protein